MRARGAAAGLFVLMAAALAGAAWAQTPASRATAPWNLPAAAPSAPAPAPASPAMPAAAPPAAQPAPETPPGVPALTTIKPVFADEDFVRGEAHFRAKNYQDAYLHLLPAGHRGHPQAQYLLGQMSEYGAGPVRRDMTEALRWYRQAAAKDHPEAQFAISNAYANGYGVQIDAVQALSWLRKSAENGYMPAMVAMAAIYDYGRGVPADPAEGSKWVKRAAEMGSVDATYQYARRLESGFGVEKSEKDAIEWYTRAANRGHPAAQLWLGSIGDGSIAAPEQNIEAYRWLTLASQRGAGTVRTTAQQRLRELGRNMMPSEINEATTRARAWRPLPQAPGLRPDPEYDVPGGTGAANAQRGAGGG
jgi:TPR repeat protein